MARERMVTRTVDITVVKCMCVDTATAQVTVDTFELTGMLESDKDIIKKVSAITPDNITAVKVEQKNHIEQLYGMPEEVFIKLATPLEKR